MHAEGSSEGVRSRTEAQGASDLGGLTTDRRRPSVDGLLEVFPQNFHEPYYASYLSEPFSELASRCGLRHVRDERAFVSKVMVFDKID